MRNSFKTHCAEVVPAPFVPWVAAAMALAGVAGCGEEVLREEPLHDGPVDPGERAFQEVGWDTVWSVGGRDDTLLHRPSALRPHREGLVVWDQGRFQVLAFDEEGELEWRFGAEGEGPDEFQDVPDLQVATDGRVFVYDHANQRVTVLRPDGAVERRVGLADVPRSNTLAVPGDTMLAFVSMSSPVDPLQVLDLDGNEVFRGDFPWDGFTNLSTISRQGRAHSLGDRWAYAFLITNGWFGFEGLESMDYFGGFVEHQGLPTVVERRSRDETNQRLAERPRCTACALSISDSLLVVHHGGHSDHARALLDLYRWDDGTYVGSRLLPGSVRQAMAVGDLVYTLEEDPFPVLTALRRVDPE